MSAETRFQWKENRLGGVALATSSGHEYSTWQIEGTPSHGAVPPTTYANPVAATAGGLMQTNPAAGLQKWLAACQMSAPGQGGTFTLFDRMLHFSGLSGTAAGAQNINAGSPATLSRHYIDNLGNSDVGQRIFVEIYTAVGVTGTTITASYTNQAGSGATTQAVTFGGTGFREIARWIELPLAAGDTGAQSITSVTIAATTGTVGNFGVVIAKPLLTFATNLQQADQYVGPIEGSPGAASPAGAIEIKTDACLFWTAGLVTAVSALVPIMAQTSYSFVDK